MIGLLPDQTYDVHETTLPPGSALYVFSDGAYEIVTKADIGWELSNLAPLLVEPASRAGRTGSRLSGGEASGRAGVARGRLLADGDDVLRSKERKGREVRTRAVLP